MARYRALRWEGRAEGLRGIAHPDPVDLAQLVGYEREQGLLDRQPWSDSWHGLPAHDALLYGAAGDREVVDGKGVGQPLRRPRPAAAGGAQR